MRIIIADDHAIVRKGIHQVLQDEFPSAEIVEVSDSENLIKKLIREKFDLVISDLSMPGRSGLDALEQIKKDFPDLPVLILSIHPEEQFAIRILTAGAAGYLNKDAESTELIAAVRRILQGRKYITPSVAEKMAQRLHQDTGGLPHESLSNREFDVFKLLAAGKSVGEIAEMMSLGSTTVSTYRARILNKMGMHNNAELTRYALDNHLI
jgi:two-component system invasion response regulator UvrY